MCIRDRFPWLSFIFIGLYIGMSFRQTGRTPEAVFNDSLKVGLPALVIGGGLCWWFPDYHFGNFFNLGPGGVVYLAGINLILLWAINQLTLRISRSRIFVFFEYLSRRVTTLYVIQWTLICWGMGLVGYQTLNAWQTLAMMPVMIALSLGTQAMLERLFRRCLLYTSDAADE